MSPLPSRGRPPGRTGGELLEVARDLLLERGYAGTSMDEVAARARISKSSLYREHPSKAHLFAAVVGDWTAAGRDSMRPALAALVEAPDVRDGLIALAQTLRAGVLSPAVLQMRRLVTSEAAAHPEVAAAYLAESWERNIEALAGTLAELGADGRLHVPAPRVAAEQFTWLVIGAPLNARLLTDHGSPAETPVTAAVDLFLAGHTRPPSAAPTPPDHAPPDHTPPDVEETP